GFQSFQTLQKMGDDPKVSREQLIHAWAATYAIGAISGYAMHAIMAPFGAAAEGFAAAGRPYMAFLTQQAGFFLSGAGGALAGKLTGIALGVQTSFGLSDVK